MMRKKGPVLKIVISILIILSGILAACIFNFCFLHEIIVGDEHANDTHDVKTCTIFNLFYTISSNTGYHPEPSNFNFVFTALSGALISGTAAYLIYRRNANTNIY